MSRDINDRLRDGDLDLEQLEAEAEPISAAAKAEHAKRPPRIYNVRELLQESAKRAAERDALSRNLTMGHYELDELTGGMAPGFVWLLGAETSWGKSSFGIMLADDNIRAGRKVLIVSSEDPKEIYADRLMTRRAKVDAQRYRRRRLTAAELTEVVAVADRAEDVPVYIEAGVKPIEDLVVHIDNAIRDEGIDLVIYDYLGEFTSREKHQDQRVMTKQVAKTMRDVVKRNNKTGIIMSQLTIADATKPPTRHNIRESRDVANAAEGILLGFTPSSDIDMSSGRTMTEGVKYLLLDKNKEGPVKRAVEMNWNKVSACFETVIDPEIERYDQLMPDNVEDWN